MAAASRKSTSSKRPKAEPPAPRRTIPPPPSGKKVIVVVEDDPETRTLIARTLSSRFEVIEAADGMEAADILDALAEPPDCVVSDIMMPKVDGLTLASRMKKSPRLEHVPVLLLSARSTAHDIAQGIDSGAKHYMVKPFSIKELLAKVTKLASGADEPPP